MDQDVLLLHRADNLTPREIVGELDAYVIGQTNAKKSVAVALRNRWRRKRVADEMRDEIMPNNILMIGPTGVGKTEIARRLARLAGAPFVKVEASKFTEVGYVGRDVESMIRDLVEVAVALVKSERSAGVTTRAKARAEARLLDALLPRPVAASAAEPGSYERTRERIAEELRRGALDHRPVDVEVKESSAPSIPLLAGPGMEGAEGNIRDMFANLFPPRARRRTLTVAEARAAIEDEEAAELVDMDAVKAEALRRAQEMGIVFIDEIDKVASRGDGAGGSGPDVSREGVQRDLLPIVEGSAITTKYGVVHTDHILFIAAGAFHKAKPSDLLPELLGRFPIRVELESLTREDFVRILSEPRTALLRQYEALLATEGVSLTFTPEAVEEIAMLAAQVNDAQENIGARRLRTVLNALLEDVLYRIPDEPLTTVAVTREMVRERVAPIVQSPDLSRHIL
jgi:ATP-dependent HslUV protease ATP-binding subunit HslU